MEQTNAQSVINLRRHFALCCLTTMTMIDGHVNWTVTGKVSRYLLFLLLQATSDSCNTWWLPQLTVQQAMLLKLAQCLWAAAHDRRPPFRSIPFWPRLRSIAWPKNGTKVSTLVSVFGLKKMWDLPWLWSREDRTSYLNLATAQPPVWTHSYSPLFSSLCTLIGSVRRVRKLIGYAK